jgi:hypothetical protein
VSQVVQMWAVQCERCEDYEGHYDFRSDAEDRAEDMTREDGRVLCSFCANPANLERLRAAAEKHRAALETTEDETP